MAEWRVSGNAGIEQRCRAFRIEPVGNTQHEFFGDDIMFRIAAISRLPVATVDAAVCGRIVFRAILFLAASQGWQ